MSVLFDEYYCEMKTKVTGFWVWIPITLDAMNAGLRLVDARAEIAAVNEAMMEPRFACREPCDTWNGPCICGAWHKEGK